MPTYEYFCQANHLTVEVLHNMDEVLETWGDVCRYAGIDAGDTPIHATVEKKLSAVSLLPKKAVASSGGGCCGGGCGCSGH